MNKDWREVVKETNELIEEHSYHPLWRCWCEACAQARLSATYAVTGAMMKYLRHRNGCAFYSNSDDCTCGLTELLTKAKEIK